MANKVKQIWSSGKAVVNGWLAIPSGFSAEVLAQSGFDSITVDLQHGVQDYLSMVQCFQAMQAHPVTPMVRVPWNEPGIIGKVLDAGAYGVICPMINTREQAEALVSYAKYPPRGARSNGPIRVGLYGEAGTYQTVANDETLTIPMIETREAVANLDEERIRQELGVFAAKIDVAEELARLSTHLDEVERVIGKGGAVGKRLDFLMQELNREANTLASKSVSTEVTAIALELKLLIEQVREQVQNLE